MEIIQTKYVFKVHFHTWYRNSEYKPSTFSKFACIHDIEIANTNQVRFQSLLSNMIYTKFDAADKMKN